MQNYTLLASDLRDLPLHQRSIHNTIDYSWRMLPDELATILAQCSSFRGAFNFESAASVAAASNETLTQLIRRSLLHSDAQENLHIHEMVRQFAAQKLAKDQAQQIATHRRHSEYYIHLLRNWWEGRQSRHLATHLSPYLDNIYAAWEWAFTHQYFTLLSHATIAFTKFHTYANLYWNLHLSIDTYRRRLQELIDSDAAAALSPPCRELQTALTFAGGLAHYYLSNEALSIELLQEARQLAHQDGYLYLASNIERFLGHAALDEQKIEDAQVFYTEAVRYAQEQQQPYSEIPPLIGLALTMKMQGTA